MGRCGLVIRCAVVVGLVLAVTHAPARAESLLRVRLNSDILGTDPAGRREENTDAVLLQIVEGLVAAKEDGTVAPMLASGWTVSDGGRVYTFTLRQGVRFHNGAALTSADVVWSLNRYLGPTSRWRCKTEFGEGGIARIVSIAAPDAQTVTVALDRPAPLFLTTLARTDCMGTGIIQRESVGPDGTWLKPIGTGPFIYDNWRRNQFVDLTRFADYAALPGPIDGNAGNKQPLVDRVRFMVIPDGSSARAALLRGSLDILDALAPSELAGVRGKPGVEISLSPNMDVYAVLFQVNDPAVADPRLRRAIALTIDRVGLTRAVTWGVGKPNASPLSAISRFHGPVEAVLGAPDIAEARRLAAEAGYHGQPIHLIANRRFPQMFDAAVLVQAMAAEAGIDLVIDTLDWASQFDAYSSGKYQAMIFSYSAKLDPSLGLTMFIGDKAADPRKVWDTPKARGLLQATFDTPDPARRQAGFDALDAAFREDAPAIVLFSSTRIVATRSNVTGFKGWPAAQMRLWGVSVQ
jgi:peptide/nickel transport system substrate-binding protein